MSKHAKFFVQDQKTKVVRFVGDTLEIRINRRFENYGGLRLEGDRVSTLMVFDYVINGTLKGGFLVPGMITIRPSAIAETTSDKHDLVVLTLKTDDIFMTSSDVVQDVNWAYVLYVEAIYINARPDFLTYDRMFSLFDYAERVTGVNFYTDHVACEFIYAHTARTKGDSTKPWRLSDRTEPPMVLPVREVAQVANTTTSKLIGAFARQGINSALVNQNVDQITELEEIIVQ